MLDKNGNGFIVLAGKDEGFYYKDGEIASFRKIEEAETFIERLKEQGYTQFVITTVVKNIYEMKAPQ